MSWSERNTNSSVSRSPSLRVLKRGDTGNDVRRIQAFLAGIEGKKTFVGGVVDGEFGSMTEHAVREWQRLVGIPSDGVVGPITLAAMLQRGLDIMADTAGAVTQFPPLPDHLTPLTSNRERERQFGLIEFRASPEDDNPEGIEITNDFVEKHIVRVTLPIISERFTKGKPVAIHREVVDDFTNWLQAIADAGLSNRILTFDGLWNPRFIRGSKSTLSAHAWATAIDINADWNGLGCVPASPGKYGSVCELVSLANQHNLYWGGHFQGRRDGMHFEHTGRRVAGGSRIQS